MQNKMKFIRTRPWLWKGTWADFHSPELACLVAPLYALAPPLALALCIWAYRLVTTGNLDLGNEFGLAVLLYGGMILAISYGVTIIVGLPWFLALSRVGWAGLIPVASGSIFPLFYIWAASRTKGSPAPLVMYLFFFVCGLLPATMFWKIIRKP